MSLHDALQMAGESGLDLVAVSPAEVPPVCRFLDYGKYKYEQSKKEQKVKKSQRTTVLKEIRLRPKIDTHDLQAKANQARKFLQEGNKVRVVLRFRGREIIYPDMGWKVLRRFAEELEDVAAISGQPASERKMIFMTLSPGPGSKKAKEVKVNAKVENT
jgi:translation initiation factor IF-3